MRAPVPSPGAASTSAPAVALFVERACASDPGFELNEQNARVVVEICRRLDGIPLAIELAAARARTIDLAEIAARLDERLRLLKASRRGGDPRHRTMEDAISWSYDLLAPEEQELFSALVGLRGALRPRVGRVDVPLGRRARPAHAPRSSAPWSRSAAPPAAARVTSCSRRCVSTAGAA